MSEIHELDKLLEKAYKILKNLNENYIYHNMCSLENVSKDKCIFICIDEIAEDLILQINSQDEIPEDYMEL